MSKCFKGRQMGNKVKVFLGELTPKLKAAVPLISDPAKFYGTEGSDAWLATLALPALAFLFFSLQVGACKASYIPTMSTMRVLLIALIGVIVGPAETVVSAYGLKLFDRWVRGGENELNFAALVSCVNMTYVFSCAVGFVVMICQFIFGGSAVLIGGLTALFIQTAMFSRLTVSMTRERGWKTALAVFIQGMLTVIAASVIFSINV